jgi:hypothetical protein
VCGLAGLVRLHPHDVVEESVPNARGPNELALESGRQHLTVTGDRVAFGARNGSPYVVSAGRRQEVHHAARY